MLDLPATIQSLRGIARQQESPESSEILHGIADTFEELLEEEEPQLTLENLHAAAQRALLTTERGLQSASTSTQPTN